MTKAIQFDSGLKTASGAWFMFTIRGILMLHGDDPSTILSTIF